MKHQILQDTEELEKCKSVRLEDAEMQALEKFVKRFPNLDMATRAIGLKNRGTLARIMGMRSGSGKYIIIIRKALVEERNTAKKSLATA